MGDKDTNMLFGNRAIFIGTSEVEMKPLEVVENSVSLHPEDAAELDRLSVREKMQVEPLRIKPQMIKGEFPIIDVAPIIGFDEALELHRCSLIIQGKPIVNKPRNIKYPNKKRARRVWKKWAKRYGTRPGKMIYFPNVEVESEYNGDYKSVNITAKPIKQD